MEAIAAPAMAAMNIIHSCHATIVEVKERSAAAMAEIN
jgi:hypothetical protein